MKTRRGLLLTVRALALVTAFLVLWHAASQATGAADTWRPCFEQGYESDPCMFQQYSAGPQSWHGLLLLWPVEMILAVGIVIGTQMLRHYRGLALAAAIFVCASNSVADYVFTPAFNGGYVSADDSPGFGFFGAACLAVVGVLLVLVGVLPRRRPVVSEPLTGRSEGAPAASVAG